MRPSDPAIVASISALVHAWLARAPAALDVTRGADWGDQLMWDAGGLAEAVIKAGVLRRLRRSSILLRNELAKCAQRYGHSCPPPDRANSDNESDDGAGDEEREAKGAGL